MRGHSITMQASVIRLDYYRFSTVLPGGQVRTIWKWILQEGNLLKQLKETNQSLFSTSQGVRASQGGCVLSEEFRSSHVEGGGGHPRVMGERFQVGWWDIYGGRSL